MREVGEVGHFLPELPESWLGWAEGSLGTVGTGLIPQETRQRAEFQSALLYNGSNAGI